MHFTRHSGIARPSKLLRAERDEYESGLSELDDVVCIQANGAFDRGIVDLDRIVFQPDQVELVVVRIILHDRVVPSRNLGIAFDHDVHLRIVLSPDFVHTAPDPVVFTLFWAIQRHQPAHNGSEGGAFLEEHHGLLVGVRRCQLNRCIGFHELLIR